MTTSLRDRIEALLATLRDADATREALLLLHGWLYLLPLVVVLAAVAGFGRGFGLPYIFREDEQVFHPALCWRPDTARARRPGRWLGLLPEWVQRALASPALWSGFGFIASFGLFWIAVHGTPALYCLRDGTPAPCPTMLSAPGGTLWMVAALAVAMLLLLPLTWLELRRRLADFTTRPGVWQRAELARTLAGCLAGGVFVIVVQQAAALGGAWHDCIIAAPYAALLARLFWRRSVLPCLSLFSLIIGLILVGMLFPSGWIWREAAILAGFAAIIVINHRRTRYRLPGFEALYGHPLNPQGKENEAEDTPLIAPCAALDGWLSTRPPDAPRPVLVLLATSGGAYRAGFWTSLLMDRLVAESAPGGRWPGLAGNIRLITGASGGMVAGAYFVAMAADGRLEEGITNRISQDTWDRMSARDGDDRVHPIARDSLSPVVHRLVTRDLAHLVTPWRPRSDRGRVLDRQWGTLARSFASLREAEAQGRAPSIILSPMLVETGAVALFSNLDLRQMRRRALPKNAGPKAEDKTSVEIFRAFRGVHETVSMATAVRLNATFPYVSPAITLPADPDRRPVDAGYYDNYGIDLLTAWLDQESVHEWIKAHCAGVAILQIRAFPSEIPTRPTRGAARALQFLTSPAEGLISARKSSQVFRNDQQLVQARQRYNDREEDFLKVFTFEASTDVSMSWYLRCDELRAMQRLLTPPVQDDLVWKPAAIRARGLAAEGAGAEVSRSQVEEWSFDRYNGDYEAFMDALQRRQPDALWAQFLHHRAKIAATFDELAAFWR